MKHIIAATLLAASSAQAIDFGSIQEAGVHTLSYHAPSNGANDLNFGAYAYTDKGYLIGAYYNSYHKPAFYVGMTSPEWWRIRVSVVGVTGYFAPVTFIVIPSVKVWQQDKMSLWISGSPVRLTDNGQAVLHASFQWRFQ